MEQVMGPCATSGQQWASWQAVFGPRRPDGGPVPLYDPQSGEIDGVVAKQYRAFDIGERVRAGPDAALIFRQRIRLVMGEDDDFYLEEAVRLLEGELEAYQFIHFPEGEHGYLKLVSGHDHGSIKESEPVLRFPREMLEHLERHGHRRGN
jgi:hypothetical protein